MSKKKDKIWRINASYKDEAVIQEIAENLGISTALTKIIVNRGYKTVSDAESFIKKNQEVLHDPFLLNDMDMAVDRIILAIEKREKITIYGDFDVDGVTSVTILFMYLKRAGANVEYYIPSRHTEGYGVSNSAIDKISGGGTNLIITVDTGVTAVDETEYAKSLGIDVIVTDHHECTEVLPNAIAVINPKRNDTTYPFPSLAGVGVAFKLLCALEQRISGLEMIDATRRIAHKYSDLAAIGTVADVMPVVDENRILISLGLSVAEKTDKIGLAALIEHCRNGEGKNNYRSKQKKKISSLFVSYMLAPRINAAGRMGSADMAVELLLSEDLRAAEKQSLNLCEMNRERQAKENKMTDEAYAMLEKNGENEDLIIILDGDDWHQGVLGIVSSRVTERYGLPSIMISFEANEDPKDMEAIGKGSGRSVIGVNMVNALHSCSDLLERYGGHELAAGLTIKRKNLNEFRKRMNEFVKKSFSGVEPTQYMDIDCELECKDIGMELVSELGYLEPYGTANQQPVFALRNAVISDVIPVGMNRHLKLVITKDSYSFTAMMFATSPEMFTMCVGDEADIAFTLDINEFNGVTSVQISVKDIKPSDRTVQFELINEDLYEKSRDGESDLSAEYVVPERDDFGEVYRFLLSSARMGIEIYRYSRLLNDILKSNSSSKINYVKLKNIIKVFRELNIVAIEEFDEFSFHFRIVFSKTKTNLEKSNILKKLKSMYPKR